MFVLRSSDCYYVTQREADLKRYRLSHTKPLPNADKVFAQDKLRARLQQAQAGRQVQVDEEDKSKSSGGSKKKVLKKPPPNFGGGKIGTK